MAWGQYRLFLLLSAALLLLLSGVSAAGRGDTPGIHGEWIPITNLSDPHIIELAEFAVTEYDKEAKKTLVFHNLVSGEVQTLMGGTHYRLVIAVIDADNGRRLPKYLARVWENLIFGYKGLDDFIPIIDVV